MAGNATHFFSDYISGSCLRFWLIFGLLYFKICEDNLLFYCLPLVVNLVTKGKMGPLWNRKALRNTYVLSLIPRMGLPGREMLCRYSFSSNIEWSPGKLGDPGASFIIACAVRFYLLLGMESRYLFGH